MDNTLLSKQKIVAEIIKCGKDPAYFINTYCKIQHPLKGTIPFKTYDFQDTCLEAFKQHRFNIVLKSRQLGLSTVTAAYCVWYALFKRDKNILVIATKLDIATNFTKKVKIMLEALPKWLVLSQFESTKQKITFDNGSVIHAIPTSPEAGRSEALSLLIVDEAAFIRYFDEIWTALYPTLTTGGSAIILSTPKGVGGQYYGLWQGAINGTNNFNPIKLMWDVHPDHDQVWFDSETRGLSKRKIAQEYLCDFVSSGDTFLQTEDLDKLRDSIREPLEKRSNVWIWEQPVPGVKYIISADVSRGDSIDFSAFHAINYQTGVVAAEFVGKIPPDKFGEFLAEWGKIYNNALIVPENNTFGYFTCKKLLELNYPALYYSKCIGDPFEYKPEPGEAPGFVTSIKTRNQILGKFEENIRNVVIRPFSQRLYTQLQGFVWLASNKAAAARGSNDDLVMSLAIGSWLLDSNKKHEYNETCIEAELLKNISVSKKTFENSHMGNIVGEVGIFTCQGPESGRRRIFGTISPRMDIRWLLLYLDYMQKRTITTARINEIIKEEIGLFYKGKNLTENENHKVALDHAVAASKLLDAIEKYTETVLPRAKTELGDSLEQVVKILKRVIASPTAYTDQLRSGTEGDLVQNKDTTSQTNTQNKPKQNTSKL